MLTLTKEKNLSVVSGFCFRYDNPKRELFKRVQQGEIGQIRTISTIRNGGPLWSKPRQPGWTDMEYRLRNWLYYSWLSGDFITEMMVHSLDMMAWAMADKPPLKATGTGGRSMPRCHAPPRPNPEQPVPARRSKVLRAAVRAALRAWPC